MTDRELIQQVLDDICGARLCEINSMSSRHEVFRLLDKAITALRERLAQKEQEHEAWCASLTQLLLSNPPKPAPCNCKTKLTAPQPQPERQWQGLSTEEIYDMYNHPRSDAEMVEFARAVEAKIKEKNT